MKLPIYLDSQATTPVDPEVLQTMLPYFSEVYGNPASRNHEFGWTAEAAVEKAREQIAKLIGAKSAEQEIVFTSGGTESNNLAIQGVAEAYKEKGNHIITSQTEHKSVLDACKFLETKGFEVTYLPVDRFGLIDLEALRSAITPKTILVSVMAANNEIGTLAPLQEIGLICKERGVLFHTDAVQAAGKIPLDVQKLGIDLLSITAHKMYGPKGVGALYLRRRGPRARVLPLLHGGGHERGLRSGTLNVPGIVGFGKAAEISLKKMDSESKQMAMLRDRLWNGIQAGVDEVYLNGHPTLRLPHNLNVSFAYVEGESLMLGIREIAMSSGSACTSATLEPSYVLKAIGLDDEMASSSIRFGISRFNTVEEIDYSVQKIVSTVKKLRELSPLYKGPKSTNSESCEEYYDSNHG